MLIPKSLVLKNLLDDVKVKPPDPNFESSTVTELRRLVLLEVGISVDNLGPETGGKVAATSQVFKSEMLKLWRDKGKANYSPEKAKALVRGNFDIPIVKVGPTGEVCM